MKKETYQTPRGRALRLFYGAKHRDLARGRTSTITAKWVERKIAAGFCAVTGLRFVMDAPMHPFAPSLDRIDNSKGYIRGNVRVVVWAYNAAKGVYSDDHMLTFAKALVARA